MKNKILPIITAAVLLAALIVTFAVPQKQETENEGSRQEATPATTQTATQATPTETQVAVQNIGFSTNEHITEEPYITLSEDGSHVTFPTNKVTTKAAFFDYDVNGTTVEILAVRALDNTIRIAFNTCQVCHGSPKAYFAQEGGHLICQNCGNRFTAMDIMPGSNGCSPMSLTYDDYTVEDGVITIPTELLKNHVRDFKNWKKT